MATFSGEREIILITGSSGLLGTALCNRLSERYQVIGFDREGPPHPPASVEPVSMDLSSARSINQGLEHVRHRHGEKIAAVIHLAAYYDFSGEPSDRYESITVQGTSRLLRALQSFEVQRFIFSSTMLVHAPGRPGDTLTEKSSIRPTWAYPRSKVRTEQMIRTERGRIPATILRIAGVYTDNCDSIPLSNQIRRIYERSFASHFFPGNLDSGQSLVHLDDVTDALEAVVDRRKQLVNESAILIGEPNPPSYNDLQREIGRLLHGKPWTTFRVPKTFAKIGALIMKDPFIKPWMIDRADDHYDVDLSKAERLLGWDPQHNVFHTLPVMIAALKKDPRGWYKRHSFSPPAWLPAQRDTAQKSTREPAVTRR